MIDLYISEPLEGLEKQVNAVLFDCDGTLVDTMGAHYRSWEAILRDQKVQAPLAYDHFCTWGGMAGHLVAREICSHLEIDHDPEELARLKRKHFLDQTHDHPLITPITDFARKVAKTHPVAVVSGGNRQTVEQTLFNAGLRDLFSVVVTPEDVVHGKPAPDMYLLAAEKLGVKPEDCLVLEDGPPGIEAATSAGMRVVAVGPAASMMKKMEK
ncbi:HAD family phosphatase [Kiritimatiellaeota bacterium B1221]|nr:HAD family phosphatase [Kiritimatiellaeota bacterium B1221]